MTWVWERMKINHRTPAVPVAVAAVIRYNRSIQGKRVGIIVTGGNVDLSKDALVI
jgi:threonine dehydratase